MAGSQTPKTSMLTSPETLNMSPAPQTQPSSASSAPAIEKPVPPPVPPPVPEPQDASTSAIPRPTVFQQGSYLDNTARALAAASAPVTGASESQGSYLDELAGPQTPKTSMWTTPETSNIFPPPQTQPSIGSSSATAIEKPVPPPAPEPQDASTLGISRPTVFQQGLYLDNIDRVRSAYKDWCKKYRKDMDDSRYKIFSGNYLAVEEHQWGGTAIEMKLNQYADCNAEEYARLKELESQNVSTATSMLTTPETSKVSPAP
jgi:hypothetical protein